jgi:hypothetical protein
MYSWYDYRNEVQNPELLPGLYRRVGTDYAESTKSLHLDQYVRFPSEGYDFSFTNAEFNIVSSDQYRVEFVTL